MNPLEHIHLIPGDALPALSPVLMRAVLLASTYNSALAKAGDAGQLRGDFTDPTTGLRLETLARMSLEATADAHKALLAVDMIERARMSASGVTPPDTGEELARYIAENPDVASSVTDGSISPKRRFDA